MNTRRSITAVLGTVALTASIMAGQAGTVGAHSARFFSSPTTTKYSFQSVVFPGDVFTQLLGINDSLVISGYHGDGMTPQTPNKGFTLAVPANASPDGYQPIPRSSFVDENYPNSAQTQVVTINRAGDTGGFYVDQGGTTHGFLKQSGNFSTVDFPRTTFNQILGLNNLGQAAGYFQDAAGVFHAYVRQPSGSFQALPLFNSQATSINDAGTVVGFTMPTATTSSGFILSGGRLILINFPGSTFTQALGVNSLGRVVGTYTDASGLAHGFIYYQGTFQSVDVPYSNATTVNGLNNLGDIVGFYLNAQNQTVGFVGRPM